jgi:hypothetical protein
VVRGHVTRIGMPAAVRGFLTLVALVTLGLLCAGVLGWFVGGPGP